MSKNAIVKISPRLEDVHNIEVNGGSVKVFDFDEANKRQTLAKELREARLLLNDQFKKYPSFPGVIRIMVREDAIAKSHRPSDFLNGMSILTYTSSREMYVAAYDKDLERAISNCEKRNTKSFVANISSIVSINCVIPDNKKIDVGSKDTYNIILKLFDYGNYEKNLESERILTNYFSNTNLDYKEITIGNKICTRIVKGITFKQIKNLLDFPFVMSIRECGQILPTDEKEESSLVFLPSRNYAFNQDDVIAVVDSGISKDVVPEKFIYARESYIPVEYQDNSHGTFVASTILFGNEINTRKEKNPINFRLLDVTIVPRINSGLVIGEDEFCECLKESVEKYHEVVKIWNLSLGFTNIIARDDTISDVGILCDELQKEYGVQFVISSGNYVKEPFRLWPEPIGTDMDRITAPSDSVICITVGSLAEKDNILTLSKKDQPSPFSRRGPGGCLTFKPELTDFGGNMEANLSFKKVGVLGLGLNGKIREDIGTSFSSPLISYKLSKIYSSLVNKDILLAKALLIHNALRHSPKIVSCKSAHRKYYGFGQPSNDCEDVLECKDNEITIVLECKLLSGTMADIKPFPFPASMVDNGKCKGEIFATLVAEPCLNKKYGYEYSRTNFDLSIGTFSFKDDGTGIKYSRQVNPLKPGDCDYKFEDTLVKEDLKWNPIKTYHRKFRDGVDLEDGWRISVQLHSRFQEPAGVHKCYVVITFIGNNNNIYNESIEAIRNQAFEMNEVETISEIRTPILEGN